MRAKEALAAMRAGHTIARDNLLGDGETYFRMNQAPDEFLYQIPEDRANDYWMQMSLERWIFEEEQFDTDYPEMVEYRILALANGSPLSGGPQ